MKKIVLLLVLGLTAIAAAFFFICGSVKYNYRWLFTKYKKLRPYVVAQSKHETATMVDGKIRPYTSKGYRKRNNAFGMRCAVVRKTNRKGCDNNYATYWCVGSSLQDLFLWMDYNDFPTEVFDSGGYVMELQNRGYFEDNFINYYNGVKFWEQWKKHT